MGERIDAIKARYINWNTDRKLRKMDERTEEYVLDAASMHEKDPKLIEIATRRLNDEEGTQEDRLQKVITENQKLSLSQQRAILRIQSRIIREQFERMGIKY